MLLLRLLVLLLRVRAVRSLLPVIVAKLRLLWLLLLRVASVGAATTTAPAAAEPTSSAPASVAARVGPAGVGVGRARLDDLVDHLLHVLDPLPRAAPWWRVNPTEFSP